jgi:hypothetical protein
MARFFLLCSIRKKIFLFAICALAYAWIQTPLALAQRRGTHFGGAGRFGGRGRMGAPHVIAPPISHAAIPRPQILARPPLVGGVAGGFRFRRGMFFGPAFFRFRLGLRINSFPWANCGAFWGFYCNALPFYGYAVENYVPPQPYEVPVYYFVPEGQQLVWLYLKDGTVFGVTDYWFMDGQVHFTSLEEGGAKSVEHVIGFDELDLQKTIDVNTRRGFRVVMRDEPLERYMHDHPDLTPPLLQPPQKN